jgi:hypothetical protein
VSIGALINIKDNHLDNNEKLLSEAEQSGSAEICCEVAKRCRCVQRTHSWATMLLRRFNTHAVRNDVLEHI